jgi:hypothetical protein
VPGCVSVVSVVCCQVEVSATGRSVVQMSPAECGVSECNLSTLTMTWSGAELGHRQELQAADRVKQRFAAQVISKSANSARAQNDC